MTHFYYFVFHHDSLPRTLIPFWWVCVYADIEQHMQPIIFLRYEVWGISGRKCPCQCWVTEERAALLPAMKIDGFKKEKKPSSIVCVRWGGGGCCSDQPDRGNSSLSPLAWFLQARSRGLPLPLSHFSSLWKGSGRGLNLDTGLNRKQQTNEGETDFQVINVFTCTV